MDKQAALDSAHGALESIRAAIAGLPPWSIPIIGAALLVIVAWILWKVLKWTLMITVATVIVLGVVGAVLYFTGNLGAAKAAVDSAVHPQPAAEAPPPSSP